MVEINKDVTFNDISTNTPITFDWNFGDGTVLTGITEDPVKHQYITPGNYTVTHKAYNACGPSTNTCTQPLTVTTPTTGGSLIPIIMAAGIGLLMMIKK